MGSMNQKGNGNDGASGERGEIRNTLRTRDAVRSITAKSFRDRGLAIAGGTAMSSVVISVSVSLSASAATAAVGSPSLPTRTRGLRMR